MMTGSDGGGGGSNALKTAGPTAFGLGYGDLQALGLRYLDAQGQAIGGGQVRFKIFGDPQGSTLSGDRAVTDPDGNAAVSLTAGAAEATFRVEASADGAPPLDFAISVSRFAFVTLDADLAYAGAQMGQVVAVRAMLYDDRACAALPPSPGAPPPLRQGVAAGPSGTVSFPLLLADGYALTGRAEDAAGHLVAYGCVDLAPPALPPGAEVAVPVPLARVAPRVTGSWVVKATIDLSQAAPPPLAAWQALGTCALAPAQPLLDGIDQSIGAGSLSDAIAQHRGAIDANGCRPATDTIGRPSLDADLEALLTAQGSPGASLAALSTDAHALGAAAAIDSRLDLAAPGGGGPGPVALAATHTLLGFTLATAGGAKMATYDPSALGFPVVSAAAIDATLDGDALSIDAHGFTARWPWLCGRALADLALTPRGLPEDPHALLAAVIDAATRKSLTGCAAVEDLVCADTAAQPCPVAPACMAAVDALGDGLAADLAAPSGIDFQLAGGATAVDADGDLVAEGLTKGTFAAQVVVLAPDRSANAPIAWTASPAP